MMSVARTLERSKFAHVGRGSRRVKNQGKRLICAHEPLSFWVQFKPRERFPETFNCLETKHLLSFIIRLYS